MSQASKSAVLASLKQAYIIAEKTFNRSVLEKQPQEIQNTLDKYYNDARATYYDALIKTAIKSEPERDSIKNKLDNTIVDIKDDLGALKSVADIIDKVATLIELAAKLAAFLV